MAKRATTRSEREEHSTKFPSGAAIPHVSPPSRRPDGESEHAPRLSEQTASTPWSPGVRGAASALILFHLTAVVVAALVAAPPFSQLWSEIAGVFRPYINAADLNHGYRFFAPDPGPSHLVRYHLVFADGSRRDGKFPDLDAQRPRLLYHRYFMLSEHLFGLFATWQGILENSKDPLFAGDQRLMAENARNTEQLYHDFAKSYADELLRRTGAKQVKLELVEHLIARPDEVTRGIRLDDSSKYVLIDTLGPFSEESVPENLP